MSHYYFLFTYSVSPYSDEDRKVKLADKVRRNIAEIEMDNWQKLEDVETTFTGTVNLQSSTMSGKRDEAEQIVRDALREVIDEHGAYSETWVNVALMVSGLGECITIRI